LIFGFGTDIIETRRLVERLRRTEGLKERIYTSREIAFCESSGRTAEQFAARFAAKEAFLKAMGTGWSGGYRFQDIEIVGGGQGRPEVVVYGKVKAFCEENGITGFHVSLSSVEDLGGAAVVLEKSESQKEFHVTYRFL
jgi:holo-[acyl-carrier protein] synthase